MSIGSHSIASDGFLYSDAVMSTRGPIGTEIGYEHIKERRREAHVRSCPGLRVGDCVPFYFCPRSPMLYTITRGTSRALPYTGDDSLIVHLESDARQAADWAVSNGLRWAFHNNQRSEQ